MQEQETINNLIAGLVAAERYKVARPYADKICKMFAITLLANESPMLAARSAVCNWYWKVQTVGVSQVELNAVCTLLTEMSEAIRKDCGKKAEQAYREADDAN